MWEHIYPLKWMVFGRDGGWIFAGRRYKIKILFRPVNLDLSADFGVRLGLM